MADVAPISPARPEVSRRRAIVIELAVVLLFAVVPPILSGFSAHSAGTAFIPGASENLRHICFQGGELVLLLFLAWSSGDPLESFGIRRPQWIRDICLGIIFGILFELVFLFGITLSMGGVMSFGESLKVVAQGGHELRKLTMGSPISIVAQVLTSFVGAVFWQAVYSGFVLHRAGELTRHRWIAVPISAALFAIQGISAFWFMLALFIWGLASATIFLRTRSLWPASLAIAFCFCLLKFAIV